MAGPIEFDDGLFHGVVAGLRDVVTFAGATADELAQAFRDSIDDYLAFSAEEGLPPDRPFSGNFMVRVPPELHRKAATPASASGDRLNHWIATRIAAAGAARLAVPHGGEPE